MSLFRRRKAEQPEHDEVPEEPPAPTGPGPWDVGDVPELGARMDLGALRVPTRPGMQVRLEIEKKTQQVVAVSLSKDGSAVQLQAFAAPRSTGLWDELREEIAASVTTQGGTADDVPGTFGRELITRLPVTTPEGRTQRPARFVGVDGPRWFLRAVFTGRAALDEAAAELLEGVLAETVVVRGPEARAPRDVLLLHLPGKPGAPEPGAVAEDPTDVLRRGPEITETR